MAQDSSKVNFKDLTSVDYTGEYLNDDGLLNYQYVKRRRGLREQGLPYRRANPRRLVERAERRARRPYLKLS